MIGIGQKRPLVPDADFIETAEFTIAEPKECRDLRRNQTSLRSAVCSMSLFTR